MHRQSSHEMKFDDRIHFMWWILYNLYNYALNDLSLSFKTSAFICGVIKRRVKIKKREAVVSSFVQLFSYSFQRIRSPLLILEKCTFSFLSFSFIWTQVISTLFFSIEMKGECQLLYFRQYTVSQWLRRSHKSFRIMNISVPFSTFRHA